MNQSRRKAEIANTLAEVRSRTLWLFDQVPDEFLRRRVHSFYSPIGWHFGHVGRTEEYWIISQAFNRPVLDQELSFLYADLVENPKDNRVNIPDREGTLDYLALTRQAVLLALEEADLDSHSPFFADGYAWEFAIQHECQHQETIAEMLQLIHRYGEQTELQLQSRLVHRIPVAELPLPVPGGGQGGGQSDHAKVLSFSEYKSFETKFREIPEGTFEKGSANRHYYDNEKDPHKVHVAAFRLAETPVTNAQWAGFIADGGYENSTHWSQEGWNWRVQENATRPEYWITNDQSFSPHGTRPLHPDEPVCSVSWYEAEAFANWSGKRLPTEVEWEYAAFLSGPVPEDAPLGFSNWFPQPVQTCNQNNLGLYGNVWEWTSSPFLPYPGFKAFPYDGYSADHMKGEHRVCRGGSWATSPRVIRRTFRNWYVPTYRQGFLGVRLAE
jgi:gamma-glutamyl hercynylcysteine S-oxide synthase